MKPKASYNLFYSSRFYILVFSFLLSVAVFAWLRLVIEGDQLLFIRAQQIYGLLCLIFWYVALIISPLGHLIGKHRMKHIEFSRRAIGVSAFYFALLHAVIALFGQLGGLGQLQYLPELFIWSLIGGAVALLVLGLMSATSFDAVIRFMTFRKWKWLHRLVYIAGILVILHVWMIGTHLAYPWAQGIGLIALSVLFGLEILRAVRVTSEKKWHLSRSEIAGIVITLWVVVVVLIMTMPTVVQNYHSRHTGHTHSQELR